MLEFLARRVATGPTVRVAAAITLAICAAASGCQSAAPAPKRGPIAGKVTLNGKPVAKGTIRFIAADPSGVNVAAPIEGGEYSVPEGQGPTKGKYVVQFSVLSDKPQRVPNDDVPGQFIDQHVETLPSRYHVDSTIMLDYDPEQTRSFDYRLTTP
jgi:hypothetical protein